MVKINRKVTLGERKHWAKMKKKRLAKQVKHVHQNKYGTKPVKNYSRKKK